MASSFSFKRKNKDPEFLEHLQTRLNDTGELAIGFPSSLRNNSAAREPNGASVVDVAIWNNFGTKTIPERRFMEASSSRISSELETERRKYMKLVIEGKMNPEMAMERLGVRAVMIIRKVINEWDSPPNSPLTIEGGWITLPNGKPIYIKGKKANNPLVDTGLMRNMATWELRKKQK